MIMVTVMMGVGRCLCIFMIVMSYSVRRSVCLHICSHCWPQYFQRRFVLLWSCWCLHIFTEVHRLCCGTCWSSLWGSNPDSPRVLLLAVCSLIFLVVTLALLWCPHTLGCCATRNRLHCQGSQTAELAGSCWEDAGHWG